WTNSGAVTAQSGGRVSLSNGTNSGAIAATASTVNFGGTWTNTAPVTLVASAMNFYGNGNFPATVTSDPASTIEFYGTISSVNLTGSVARVGISGGTIQNGALTLNAGQALHVDNGGTLSNVTLVGNLDLQVLNAASLNVPNVLPLNGTAYVGSADNSRYGEINFYGTQTIGGTGDIVFGSHVYNALYIATSATAVTLGPGLTVHGVRGTLQTASGDDSFINQGTLIADGGDRIDVGRRGYDNGGSDQGSMVNQGTLA